jgi:hypothetical protein
MDLSEVWQETLRGLVGGNHGAHHQYDLGKVQVVNRDELAVGLGQESGADKAGCASLLGPRCAVCGSASWCAGCGLQCSPIKSHLRTQILREKPPSPNSSH